jgi:Rrf2 family protein
MKLSKKCVYALKAVFELSARNSHQPVKIHDLAAAQQISPRFLEVIMNELRHGGVVESRRGVEGGYMLAGGASDVSAGRVIRCIQGPMAIEPENGGVDRGKECFGDYAFARLWEDVNAAISEVCDKRTFADLVEIEQAKRQSEYPDYVI